MAWPSGPIKSLHAARMRRVLSQAHQCVGCFFLSIEFQETGFLVYRIYKAAYGNLPNAPVPVRFSEFLPDTQQIGHDVVVGVGNWQAQLEINKQAFAADVVPRARFTLPIRLQLLPHSLLTRSLLMRLSFLRQQTDSSD